MYAQPLPSPSPSDRIISTTVEPSLTTKDAVDKYQLISEEVHALYKFHFSFCLLQKFLSLSLPDLSIIVSAGISYSERC